MTLDKARPTWPVYFMGLALEASLRSTCTRRKVGALFVTPDKQLLATGYNGSPPKMPHCTDVGCQMFEGHCIRTIHAEDNAINSAAKHGISLKGSIVYVTCHPCHGCSKRLVSVGVSKIVYLLDDNPYIDPHADELLRTYAKYNHILYMQFVESLTKNAYLRDKARV